MLDNLKPPEDMIFCRNAKKPPVEQTLCVPGALRLPASLTHQTWRYGGSATPYPNLLGLYPGSQAVKPFSRSARRVNLLGLYPGSQAVKPFSRRARRVNRVSHE